MPDCTGAKLLADPYCAIGAIGKVINAGMRYGIVLIVVLAIAYFVYGAIKYITAADDPKRLEEARRTLLYAILGMILGVSGYGMISMLASAIPGGIPGIPTPAPPPPRCSGPQTSASADCFDGDYTGQCLPSAAACPGGGYVWTRYTSCTPGGPLGCGGALGYYCTYTTHACSP